MAIYAALIGFGSIARHGHLPWYLSQPAVELTGVVEPTSSGRALALDLLPQVQVFSSVKELLESQNVTFVDITAPPAAHSELILAATARGVHVICEKPFVRSWQELQHIEHIRRPGGPIIAACHNWYFAPIIRRGLEFVTAALIGNAEKVCFTALRPQSAKGVEHWEPEWRQAASKGGGVIGDLGYHGIYLASRIFGRAPLTVHANCLSSAAAADGAERSAFLKLDYGEGKRAELTLSWLSTMRETTLQIHGSRGSLIIDGDSLRLAIYGQSDIEERFESLTHDSWHAAWIADTLDCFLRAIQRGDQDGCWQDIEWSVSVLDAAYESAKSGAAVATRNRLSAATSEHLF